MSLVSWGFRPYCSPRSAMEEEKLPIGNFLGVGCPRHSIGWGQRMAGSDHGSAATWKDWINTQFAARGNPQQQSVAEALGVGNSTVSKWRKGVNPPDADAAVRAAKHFGRPAHEALRAAGHHELADLVDPAVAGVAATTASDPFADEIMSWTYLGIDVRRKLLEQYQAKRVADMEDARTVAGLLRNAGNGDAA